MNCPSCKTAVLEFVELENGLNAKQCKSCRGHWLNANQYWKWLEGQSKQPRGEGFTEVDLPNHDSKQAMICPDCSHLLIKFNVSSEVDFTLDRCNNCNGFWLDENEWITLKNRNLHEQIHRVCTTEWQKQIRQDVAKQKMAEIYAQRFGLGSYEELKRIKKWLGEHEHGEAMLLYLNDDDPYQFS